MKLIAYIVSAYMTLIAYQAKGQTAAADNKVQKSITFAEVPKSRTIYGIFEGRTPCIEIGRQLGDKPPADCDHLKWQIIFFRDTLTLKPTAFVLKTELFDRQPLKGKWTIIQGTKTDPAAIVYKLSYGQQGKSLYLLKGDENVLFILDENLQFRTGNRDYGYTLSRVLKVRHLSGK